MHRLQIYRTVKSIIKNIKQTAVTNIMEQRMLIVDFQIYFKLNVNCFNTITHF